MGNKCKHKKAILASAWICTITPDQEPRKTGKLEEMENIEAPTLINLHYCEKCQIIVDVWIEPS